MFLDYVLDVVIGLVFTVFFFTAGILLAINCRTLYYRDIDLLDLEQEVKMDRNLIIKNYDSLIDYMSPSSKSDLKLSNFAISDKGVEHFKDVKFLIKLDYIAAAISCVICCFIVISKAKKRDFEYLMLSSICVSAISFVLGCILVYDFKKAFDGFRRFFLDNENFSLNVSTDSVVSILPNTYFMHCALAILVFSFLSGACMFIIWKGLIYKLSLQNEEAK